MMSPAETHLTKPSGWTITISRQMGSLGMEVAQALADLLHYRKIRQEMIKAAALRAGTPEMMLAFIDDLGLLDVCPSPESCLAFRTAIYELMHEYAAEGGVVIVGRAGQVILKDNPRALHVRVIAPLNVRIERVSRSQGIPAAAAQAQIEASDHHRKTYLRRFYQVRWSDPSLYHLVLNTAFYTPEQAARLIQAALVNFKSLDVQPLKPSSAASLPEHRRSIT
jgi:cytidylate kinase